MTDTSLLDNLGVDYDGVRLRWPGGHYGGDIRPDDIFDREVIEEIFKSQGKYRIPRTKSYHSPFYKMAKDKAKRRSANKKARKARHR